MNELQASILEIMDSVHDICKSNNLRYYMVGGTLLGSVRHQGFIPWDDDIDIAMPRKDFNVFVSLESACLPDWVEIVPPSCGSVNMGYAKVFNRNTTLVENYKGVRIGGVFIDVFPLDGVGNSYDSALKRLKHIKIRTFMLRANQGLSTQDSILRKLLGTLSKILSTNTLYNLYLREAVKYDFYTSSYVANTVGVYNLKELTRREVFGEPTLYPFENRMYYGVEDPESYLSGLYGDYMSLPPKEKRVSQHGVVYLDLHMPYKTYGDTFWKGKG